MSEQRKYSVWDLDALRQCVRNKYLFGTYRRPTTGGTSRSYKEDEMVRVVEEEVRTHMLAGHTAADLTGDGESGETGE